jgi:hypothetical protein
VSRITGRKPVHHLTVRRDFWTGAVTWTGHSEWDAPKRAGSRLRTPMSRSTWLSSEAEARRWARRYKVDLPMPDPLFGPDPEETP